ncbi:MAG: RHS repeat-associated core domain-containing protein [Bacteroidales bacterium]
MQLAYNRFRWYSNDTGTYISQDPIGLAGNNPNLYGYVFDSNTEVDPFGLAPTNKADRDFLKEILGSNAKEGGVYMFKEKGTWYVGKSNNLYRRLREHLGSSKLTSKYLNSLQVIVEKGGKNLFKLESEVMDEFKNANVNLTNKINSPGSNMCK